MNKSLSLDEAISQIAQLEREKLELEYDLCNAQIAGLRQTIDMASARLQALFLIQKELAEKLGVNKAAVIPIGKEKP